MRRCFGILAEKPLIAYPRALKASFVIASRAKVLIHVTTRATSVVEGRKEGRRKGRNNRKEYHSISRARKVRLEIVVSYCNILKVSQVLAFSTLGCCSFPFYKQMEGASRLTYGITKVHSL